MTEKQLKGSVYGTVRVTIEVSFSQPWSLGETMENIVRIAQRDGEKAIMNAINSDRDSSVSARVLHVDPDVTLRFKGGEP